LQDSIRERVMVEKTVVEEEEKIKDTRQFAGADREKRVAITKAEEVAEEALVKDIKSAEASKKSAEFYADQQLIEAQANEDASVKNAEAKKTLAVADIKEQAVNGVAEAEVTEAKAGALEKHGTAEAKVMELKYHAEADGIRDKAEAMKIYDAVGKDHEEFKLNLNKKLEVELAEINVQKEIAEQQAIIVGEALKSARIDIVGGDNNFFNRLVNSITTGKTVDRVVENSEVLGDLKGTLIGDNSEETKENISKFIKQFGLGSDDIKNLSVSALIIKLMTDADDSQKGMLKGLLETVKKSGIAFEPASDYVKV